MTKGILLCCLALSLSLPLLGEQGPKKEPKPVFPATWAGTWRGSCTNWLPGRGLGPAFPMELIVKPGKDPARTGWTLIYGSGPGRQVRSYELVTVDGPGGHFRIDERNSIVLDAWYREGVLCQLFRVGKAVLHVRFAREAAGLAVEMASYDHSRGRVTGGGKGSPKVTDLPLKAVQRGVLKRVP